MCGRAAVLTLGCATLLATACTNPQPDYVNERFFAMGTWVDLTFLPAEPAGVDAVLREVEDRLRRDERDFYAWAPGELAALNTAIRNGEPFTASPRLAQFLRDAQQLAVRSGGTFEPGLGPLVELWGFHSGDSPGRSPPSDDEVSRALRASAGISSLHIEQLEVRGGSRGLSLDLGGIAKGAVVDRTAEILAAAGIRHALINAGGDLRVIGRRRNARDSRPWRIGIRHPRNAGLLGVITLDAGEAAFTSGDYERFFDHEGERLHHILDPQTGYPVNHTQAVTVIAADGVTADAAATALFVAGPDRWRDVATALSIQHVLRVDASGEIELTRQMSDRLQEPGSSPLDIMSAVP